MSNRGSAWLFSQAIQCQQKGLHEQALKICQQILGNDKKFIDAHMMQGVIWAQRQSYARAAEHFLAITKIDAKHVGAHYNLGLMWMNGGHSLEAEKAFERVLAMVPNHAPSLNGLGVIRAQRRSFEAASACFNASLAVAPNQPETLNNWGNCCVELEKFQEAEQHFLQALGLNSQYSDALFNLAKLYSRMGMPAKAIDAYQSLLRLQPTFDEARVNLSKLWVDQGQAKTAVDLLRERIESTPQNAIMWFSLGVAHKESDAHAQAIQAFDHAISLKPDYLSAYVNRGACWRELGHLDKAWSDLDRADAAMDPETQSIAWSLRATLYEDTDQQDKVENAFRRSLDLDPTNLKPRMNYGIWLLKQQRFKEGWPYYQYRHRMAAERPISWLPQLPIWRDGSTPQRLLLIGEQGVGDQVLHSRFLQVFIRQHGIPACVVVDDRMTALMSRSFPLVKFWPQSRVNELRAENFDAQMGLGDLGFLLSIDPRIDLMSEPFPLLIDNEISLPFHRRGSRPLIGVSWKSTNAKLQQDKSMALIDMMRELRHLEVDWVNLQYGEVNEEIDQVWRELGVRVHQVSGLDVKHDIEGLMKLIQDCDGVLTTSNSTAHFCGAVGQVGVVLVPYSKGKLWYWHMQDGFSSWYPSMRVVHCSRESGWISALAQAKQIFQGKW